MEIRFDWDFGLTHSHTLHTLHTLHTHTDDVEWNGGIGNVGMSQNFRFGVSFILQLQFWMFSRLISVNSGCFSTNFWLLFRPNWVYSNQLFLVNFSWSFRLFFLFLVSFSRFFNDLVSFLVNFGRILQPNLDPFKPIIFSSILADSIQSEVNFSMIFRLNLSSTEPTDLSVNFDQFWSILNRFSTYQLVANSSLRIKVNFGCFFGG